MDSEQFCDFAKASADYLAKYLNTIREKQVLPNVQPGYLQTLIPNEPPENGESWQEILKDMDRVIMPGITHWHSPNFHAYFAAGQSYPGIVGEMMCAGISCIGLNWVGSPACTELEVAMMNWLGKLLDLPEEFLNCSEGLGGGVLQGSASESTLVGLLTAKERTVSYYRKLYPDMDENAIKARLVAYTSDQSNSSVEKAGMLGSMPMRLLAADENGSFRGATLKEAMDKDRQAGLIPCYVVATLGTTVTCAFDNLEELGPLCNEENVWLHVDAAYAGTALACPEFRPLMKGIQYVDSFNFNLHKWMLVPYDCSAMWVKNARYLVEAFNVERIYLTHEYEDSVPDYRHWQIALGRRFRALKVWFVLRSYGAEGIRNHVRHHVALAKYFEGLMGQDDRFEVVSSNLGLVCFRLKGSDYRTRVLLDKLTERKNIFMIPGTFLDRLIIRFCICSRLTQKQDVLYAWNEILFVTDEILADKLADKKTETNAIILNEISDIEITEKCI